MPMTDFRHRASFLGLGTSERSVRQATSVIKKSSSVLIARAVLVVLLALVVLLLAYRASCSVDGDVRILAGPLWSLRSESWDLDKIWISGLLIPMILAPVVRPHWISFVVSLIGGIVWLWFGVQYEAG